MSHVDETVIIVGGGFDPLARLARPGALAVMPIDSATSMKTSTLRRIFKAPLSQI